MLWLTKSTVRPPLPLSSLHSSQALFLEIDIADGQHLVDDQDLRLQMRGNSKGEPHIHARAVALDRRVEKFLDLGKGDDLVELRPDLRPRHAQDGAVQIDVLAPVSSG